MQSGPVGEIALTSAFSSDASLDDCGTDSQASTSASLTSEMAAFGESMAFGRECVAQTELQSSSSCKSSFVAWMHYHTQEEAAMQQVQVDTCQPLNPGYQAACWKSGEPEQLQRFPHQFHQHYIQQQHERSAWEGYGQQCSKRLYGSHATAMRSQEDEAVALAAHYNKMLEAGGTYRDSALNELQSPELDLVNKLVFASKEGSKVVQKAIKMANRKLAFRLVQQLKGRISKAVKCPNANYVVQDIIRLFPLSTIGFVVQEVEQMGPKLVFHQYGCRIYCRMLEYQSSDERTVRMVDKVLQQMMGDSMYDVFGQVVVESILEHGQASHKAKILTELKARPIRAVRHERGAFVVAKALEHGCAEDVEDLSQQILAQRPEHLAGMASSRGGLLVAQALMQKPQTRQILNESPAALAKLRACKYGKKILKELKQPQPRPGQEALPA